MDPISRSPGDWSNDRTGELPIPDDRPSVAGGINYNRASQFDSGAAQSSNAPNEAPRGNGSHFSEGQTTAWNRQPTMNHDSSQGFPQDNMFNQNEQAHNAPTYDPNQSNHESLPQGYIPDRQHGRRRGGGLLGAIPGLGSHRRDGQNARGTGGLLGSVLGGRRGTQDDRATREDGSMQDPGLGQGNRRGLLGGGGRLGGGGGGGGRLRGGRGRRQERVGQLPLRGLLRER